MNNNDVDIIVEMDYAADQSLCRQPRLHVSQALAPHPSANQAAQVASHHRGNTRNRPNTQVLLSSAAWPPLNPGPHGLELQAPRCPSSNLFPTIRKGRETSLTGLAQLCTKVDNHHKTIGTDKQMQPSANRACHNTDEDRNNKHLSSFLANKAIIKATNQPVFAASDIPVGRAPFEELITDASLALNEGISPLQRDILGAFVAPSFHLLNLNQPP